MKPALLTLMIMALATGAARAAVSRTDDAIVVSGDGYSASFSDTVGASLTLRAAGEDQSILTGGEQGLWHVRFSDSSVISATDFRADTPERRLQWTIDDAANAVRIFFRSAEIEVVVTVTGREDGIDLSGEVTPKERVVLDFALPARLRFDPDQLERFICPANGNQSVGTAFKSGFFKLQPQDRPSAWGPEPSGPRGYIALFGGPLDQRADRDEPTQLRATNDGREWLGEGLAGRVTGAQAVVNRASTRDQVDLVIADSDNGPYFASSTLGGAGRLWRIGGSVGDNEKAIAAEMVGAVIRRLAESSLAARTKIGLISLNRGPDSGGWSAVSVGEWRERLQAAARATGAKLVELTTPSETLAATSASDFIAILNPYGEWTPVPHDGGMDDTVRAVGQYVRAGGNWFEVGGYPFFYAMRPVRYLTHATPYPPAFADFFHLDTQAGRASIYRVQPQVHDPWAGADDHSTIFIPGRLACGGDEQGGYCDRPFATYVKPGETWRSPLVRLTVGNAVEQDLRAYCEANAIRRRLEEKMPPDVLDKFKRSVLVYYAGACREKIDNLERLPVPSQVHFADYLKGGFDKEYPDHLPPHPNFGTAEEFREFFDRCHELGHLVMPYTNPTWWCDHPKGPTFERDGTDPLLRKLDGELSYERYVSNDGFTVCHWHPAARAANAKTVHQFADEYPVDILFQDQCGARSWHYDTNPASPTPYAYVDGLISMVAEDSRTKPLSTEGGWDRVVNYESQLCGMSWSIVPTEGGPSWRKLMKHDIPPETWEVFPLAQHIAHDKTAMLYHDLGQFVTNREVLAWTVALGFCMSYRVGAAALTKDAPREWLRWLDRVQKSVCARYVGEPIQAFEHDRGPEPSVEHDGVIRAAYGPVTVVANLGPTPVTEGEIELPPYGFRATGPGLVAGNLTGSDEESISFVAEQADAEAELWIYSPPERRARVELPSGVTGDVALTFDDGATVGATVTGGSIELSLPPRPGAERVTPPPALAGRAPRDWPGERPAIGVIDLGEGVNPTWTRITPADWLAAFEESRLAAELGVPVHGISTVAELVDALEAGATKWLAIVNPYGETFPAEADWRTTLGRIRDYVSNGGCWWETGGYSFYVAVSQDGEAWRSTHVGLNGMATFGLPVGGGDVDQPPEPLRVTPSGRAVLGEELTARVEAATSTVNRGLSRGSDDPGHAALVAGRNQDFIGAYRLDGWGHLWRIGGFHPNPQVALPVSVAAMEFVYTHPPLPVAGGGIHYLWHAKVKAR